MKPATRRDFLMTAARCTLLGSASAFFAGCKTLETASTVGTQIGAATGVISYEQAESIDKSIKAIARTTDVEHLL